MRKLAPLIIASALVVLTPLAVACDTDPSPGPVSPHPLSTQPLSTQPISPHPVIPQPVIPQPVIPQPADPPTNPGGYERVPQGACDLPMPLPEGGSNYMWCS